MRNINALILLTALCAVANAQDRQKFLVDRQNVGAGDIKILDALYGQDDRLCRAQAEVARDCDGRASCEIRADDSLCGNPYANVAKQLFIGYSCGTDRRSVSVDEGQTAYVYCAGGTQPVVADDPVVTPATDAPPANWRRSRIYIARAAYGAGTRVCDATASFSYECDGQRQCEITVSNDLCGDPARGTAKEAAIEYWCNGNLELQSFREGQLADLRCN